MEKEKIFLFFVLITQIDENVERDQNDQYFDLSYKAKFLEEDMGRYILTSMFPNGFHGKTKEVFQQIIHKRKRFAFVASEFLSSLTLSEVRFQMN